MATSLKARRRAVEQLEQEAVRRQLLQGRDGWVGEAGVGVGADLGAASAASISSPVKRAEDVGGDLGVGPSGEGGDLGGVNCGHASGT